FIVGDDAGTAQATSTIFISSTGNVGIGTTTPQSKLDVYGTTTISGPSPTLTLEGGGTRPVIRWTPVSGLLGLSFRSNNTEVARIQDNGHFLATRLSTIGGTNLGDFFIQRGSIDGGMSFPGSFAITFGSGTISGSIFASEYARFIAGGNLGIGTASPAAKLSIATGTAKILFDTVLSGYGAVGFGSTLTTSNAALIGNTSDTILNAPSGGTVFLRVNNDAVGNGQLALSSDKLVYTDGNVGIGTTSPSTRFSVGGVAGDTTGHGYFTGGLGIGKVNTNPGSLETSGNTGVGASLFIRTVLNCNAAASTLQTDGSGTVVCGTVTAIGGTSAGGWTWVEPNIVKLATTTDRVGIGVTTPTAKLDVNSGSTATTTLALNAVTAQTSNILEIFDNNNTLNSVVTPAGFWGLGIASPSERLHVSGNLLLTGNSTTTNATTTNFFSTTASSTNLFFTTGTGGHLTSSGLGTFA
ncbi:MAG: hypothetical protein WD972_00130, partial [Candidatus Andersenbacteria bacterium]